MNKIKLLVLCGGQSAEHEISLISGWNLCNKLKSSEDFEVTLITIDKEGSWFLQNVDEFIDQQPTVSNIYFGKIGRPILLKPGASIHKFYLIDEGKYLSPIDVVFPLLHGPNGEDGTMQGLLSQLQLPYIGPNVLGSAICMDKDYAKRLMQHAGIPTSDYVVVDKKQIPSFERIIEKLGTPIFVKPANMGSSVGISKVRTVEEYSDAIQEAFKFDNKLVIEEFVEGIEVECAVLGNEDAIVSQAGTYVHPDDFFDFDTKYSASTQAVMQIPAAILNQEQQREVMSLSLKAYHTLGCSGLSRVDTFFTKDGRFLVNEINTLPGFTKNSMYPILMESKGIDYISLVKRLCELAILRG